MAEKKLTAFRLPEDMLEQLDRVAEKLTSEQPGMSYTRADAVRILLARGITAELGSKDTRPVRKVAKGAKREE
ncbi:MAG: hypothetical protein HYV07_04845 [Deltaproteobacteria bacterium]|nr:hypothetical protein [Deltaproteobacteria bacterium]